MRSDGAKAMLITVRRDISTIHSLERALTRDDLKIVTSISYAKTARLKLLI